MSQLRLIITILSIAFLAGCTSNTVDPEESAIKLNFAHLHNGDELVLDDIRYTNEVGQEYSIQKVKYFVSKITFHKNDGTEISSSDIHFVDIKNSETLAMKLATKIPYGNYDKISFVYGLIPEDNISKSLGIDLDREMEWPEIMGGGYHYMKLEGKYTDNNITSFFNFHTGGLNGTAYEIHVDLPNSNFTINENSLDINLVMEMSNWFTNPVDWNFEYWGSGIMGNPDAQTTVQQNGIDVFSVIFLTDKN